MPRTADPANGNTDGSFRSVDLDEIVDWYARHVRIRLSASALTSPVGLCLEDRRVGRVRIARSRVPAELTVVADSSDAYVLAIVGAGALHVDEQPRRWALTPAMAGLYRPPRTARSN